MLGQQQRARASYSPHRAGQQGPRRMGRDPSVQLTVGALWEATTPPSYPGLVVGSRECAGRV